MSSTLKLPGSTAAALRPTDVRQYLTSRGWVSEPFGAAGKGLRFTHVDYPKIDLLLPLKRDLRDYAERMSDLAVALSPIENRPMGEVLNDLTGPAADILRFRLWADVATLGSLPLEEGIQFLRGGHDLLLAAAASHAQAPRASSRTSGEAGQGVHGIVPSGTNRAR